jgi:hypothetical protein
MNNDSKSTLHGNKTDQDQDQLRDDQLKAVSGGTVSGGQGGHNDPAQLFAQIMQQVMEG